MSAHELVITLSTTDSLGTSWRSSQPPPAAQLGRLAVGPAGLVERLATWLGVPTQTTAHGARVAALARRLRDLDRGDRGLPSHRWFSASLAADPFGAAQWLLSVSDQLRLQGWDGRALPGREEGGSDRLAAVSIASAGACGDGVAGGSADLAWRVLAALQERTLQERTLRLPLQLQLDAPLTHFSPLLQAIVQALQAQSVTVTVPAAAVPSGPAQTDLGRLQRALRTNAASEAAGVELHGDGSLCLLVADSPVEAAALACAVSADAGDSHSAPWLVTAEGLLLDRVRARWDQPGLGSGQASRFRPALQVLPLVLALQTAPQDPQTALELLTLPTSPVPARLRRHLLGALAQQPALGGPAWLAALDAGLEPLPLEPLPEDGGEAAREGLRQRVHALFPSAPAPRIDPAAAAVICELVARWAQGRGRAAGDDQLLGAAGVARRLALMLRELGTDTELDRLGLLQLHDLAVGAGLRAGQAAQRGAPPAIGHPAAVPASLERLVWFGLVPGAAELGRAVPWTMVERHALRVAGVSLPATGERRQHEQEVWLRAVLAPTASLTLVSWRSSGGEPVGSHPLLELLSARLSSEGLRPVTLTAAGLLRDQPAAGAQQRPSLGLPRPRSRVVPPSLPVRPRGTWRLPVDTIDTQRHWSASSIEALVTCPLRWTLSYAAGLRPGSVEALPGLRTVAGSFAHALFEEVLFEAQPGWAALTPLAAQARLLERFDARLATEAAPLALPANQGMARRLRARLGTAIHQLVDSLKAGGWVPHAAELDVSTLPGRFDGQSLKGAIDLVLAHPDGRRAVVDLKLGGRSYRADSLRQGTALQLAVYARALSTVEDQLPRTAYFILEEGELLTADAADFPGATQQDGPTAGATFLEARAAWTWSAQALRAGVVLGTGDHLAATANLAQASAAVGRPPPDHPWQDEAPCRFCDAVRLCTFSVEQP